MTCTWKHCSAPSRHPRKDRMNRTWCKLCDEHDAELTKAIDSGKPRELARAWVLAQGGAQAAAKRIR